MAAYFLQSQTNAPIQITLFDAAERVGGKVVTCRFTQKQIAYEAGAAEFYDYSATGADPLKELITDDLNLPIRQIGGSAVLMDQKLLANLDDFREHFGEAAYQALLDFDRIGKDWMSPREYYSSDNTWESGIVTPSSSFDGHLARMAPPETRRFIERLIHSDLATEPKRTSFAYGLQNYLMNDPRYLRQYRIEGGNQRFPEELARRIDATWRLQHRVTSIGRNETGKLQISAQQGNASSAQEFDFVVVALPGNYLPKVEFRGEKLAAAMREHHLHYDHPAHYLRISILFERPFWREKLEDSYFMLDAFGGCCLYDETPIESKAGVLGWLLAGDAAQELSELEDPKLISLAIESLPAVLHAGRESFLEGHVHRWIGAVNAMPGGTSPRGLDRRHQPEPQEHSDFFVVGDYMFDSTINGLLDSAEYVADWIAAEITSRQ